MIKKFKEFTESTKFDKRIRDILSMEDVEDQFLRLKEVLNCEFSWQTYKSEIVGFVGVTQHFNKKYLWSKDIQKIKIIKELETIKKRMEEIYPVSVRISRYIKSNSVKSDTLQIYGYFVVSITPGFKDL